MLKGGLLAAIEDCIRPLRREGSMLQSWHDIRVRRDAQVLGRLAVGQRRWAHGVLWGIDAVGTCEHEGLVV